MAHTIIDPHAHIIPQREPVWGWGPNFTVDRLLAMMDRDYEVMGETKHVAKAVVMTGLGLTSVEHRTMAEAHTRWPASSSTPTGSTSTPSSTRAPTCRINSIRSGTGRPSTTSAC
jgi:hypothetical protein